MAQHYELEDAEFGKLADRVKKIAIVEMGHAEALAERILFLGGVPTTKLDTPIKKQEEIPAMMQTDVGLETGAIEMYNRAAKLCAEEGDTGSRELFEKLVAQEEDHQSEFENTLDHINKLGPAYLATLIG
jgi:bacterioferritin